jgi:hypothetical protein
MHSRRLSSAASKRVNQCARATDVLKISSAGWCFLRISTRFFGNSLVLRRSCVDRDSLGPAEECPYYFDLLMVKKRSCSFSR